MTESTDLSSPIQGRCNNLKKKLMAVLNFHEAPLARSQEFQFRESSAGLRKQGYSPFRATTITCIAITGNLPNPEGTRGYGCLTRIKRRGDS